MYGAMFGLRICKGDSQHEDLHCVLCRICDDVERSLRAYAYRGPNLTFMQVTVQKRKNGGTWKANDGGLSALFCDEAAHKEAKKQELLKLCEATRNA